MKHKWMTVLVSLALALGLFGVLPTPRVLAATYYSTGSVTPSLQANWKTNRDGTGSSPTNFISGDTFVIQNGHNMTTTTTWSVSGAGSKIWIENGGTLTANGYSVVLNSGSTFQIDSGGTYVHNTNAAYGSSVFQGIENFDAASTVILNNSNSAGPSGVAFGNLIVDFTSTPGGAVNCAGGLTTINGDLTIQSTSSVEFRLSANTAYELTIAGDLNINGGTLNLTNGTSSGVSYTVNLGGDFAQTGGTFRSESTASPSTFVFVGGSSPLVTFSTSGGTFTNTNINWQIASGKTVALNTSFGAGSWVNTNRTMTVNGALQINQGAYPGTVGAWSYGSGATLIFNNTSGSYGVGNEVWWPSAAARPTNVAVQGAGGITMNTARTVDGTFQTAAALTNGSNLTLNGIAQINTGGSFTGSPTYGSNSTLVYNPGGSFTISDEWKTGGTVGSGVPKNVTIQNATAVTLPNGAGSRTVNGDLTITSGSLALGGNIGDDLNIGGNWINNGGTFNANSRTVTFNGSSPQSIGGTAATAFAYLTINNSSGVMLGQNQTVNTTLTLSNGLLTLGAYNLTIASNNAIAGGPFDASKMVVADGSGALCKVFTANGSYDYPIGDNTSGPDYSPVTSFSVTGTSYDNAAVCFRVTDAVHPSKPAAATTYITRYWTGTQSGTIGTLSYGVTFNFVSGDVAGAEAMNGKKWNTGPAWTELGTVSGTTFAGSSLTDFSAFTAFKSGILAVTLADFFAQQVNDYVRVTWETASELGNMGFNLYRGTSPAGPDRRLNGLLIPSQSLGSPSGFTYTWDDSADLVPGTTYYYWVEDVDVNGAATRHGPVSVDFSVPTAVTLTGIQASPAAGMALPWLWVVAVAGAALALGRRR